MFYFIATILLNVVISALFKLFPKYGINALQAIVVNYCVCIVTGSIFLGRIPFQAQHLREAWFPWAIAMGAGFISIFNLISYCTRVDGITTATIANKLSLVIPVLFAIFFLGEQITLLKVVGIALALPAVYLATRVKEDNGKIPNLLWPILLFVGSGLLDTVVNIVQHKYLGDTDNQAVYTTYVFSVAACIGVTLIIILALLKKIKLHPKNILAGIAIGVPNYFSIYFLIRALNSNVLPSSSTIPVINIGILVASSLTAILIFREKANMQRIIGLVLAVVAICLIAFQTGTSHS